MTRTLRHGYTRPMRESARIALVTIAIIFVLSALTVLPGALSSTHGTGWRCRNSQLSKEEFDVVEGHFHDGLGTFAELALANELIAAQRLTQPMFDLAQSTAKMTAALRSLPADDIRRNRFEREINNVRTGAKSGALMLLRMSGSSKLTAVRHTAREYSEARAGDIRLEFADRAAMPVSVKTDKSHKVAVAEGQTPDIEFKWCERYFRVSPGELAALIHELGFADVRRLKSHYLNVARLVAAVMIKQLGIVGATLTDFSKGRVTDLTAAKYLFRQLRLFKSGRDHSQVIIFDRGTGEVRWESLLDSIDIDSLTADRISFLPSRPRFGLPIGSEFGIRIDDRTVVSFQIKHRRGRSRGTSRQLEFSDITTRLRV